LKKIVDILNSYNMTLLRLEEVSMTLLGSRKKIRLFCGLTQKKYYICIFFVGQKSRFLRKNANELLELQEKLEKLKNRRYKKRVLLISSPLCSKAKSFLSSEGWKIYEVEA